MATFDHAGSEIVPVWPVALVASTSAKVVVRTSARGSAWQPPLSPQADGASTIHSAELTSTCATCSCVANDVPRVRSARKSFTVWPETVTLAEIVSPGRTVRLQLDGRGGDQLVPRRVVALAAGAIGLGADLLERARGRVQPAEAQPGGGVAPPARAAADRRRDPRGAHAPEARARDCSRRSRPSSCSWWPSSRRATPAGAARASMHDDGEEGAAASGAPAQDPPRTQERPKRLLRTARAPRRTVRCTSPRWPPIGTSRLLRWYARERRDLPWRRTRDPYAMLVSEVMLQQTQVARVIPRYEAWLARWPTAEALAAAPLAGRAAEWVGLGYNRRARAPVGGGADRWRATAGPRACRSCRASGPTRRPRSARSPSGARRWRWTPTRGACSRGWATALVPPPGRAADFNQATMELGATVCTARGAALRRVPAGGGLRRPGAAGARARRGRASASRTPTAGSAGASWRRWRRARGCRAASRPSAWQPALQGLVRDGLIRQVAGGYALG